MRHAIVVAPPRFVLPQEGSVFAAPEPVGPVCAALARGGSLVMLVRTSPELIAEFERAIGAIGPNDDLVVYVAASTTARDGVVLLRLEEDHVTGDIAGELRHIGEAVAARGPSAVVFIVDARFGIDGDDPIAATEHGESILRALDPRRHGYGAAIGVSARPPFEAAAIPWTFTQHLLAALDDETSRDESGAARMSLVIEGIRRRSAADPRIRSFAFVPPRSDLVIVAAPGMPRPPPAANAPAIPEPRSTQPSLPAIEPLIDLADDALDRGELPEALAGYKAALMVAPLDDKPMRASIYARIGELKRAQGKPREAELNFEKALAADPAHMSALDALLTLATESHDVKRTVYLRGKRLATMTGADDRAGELRAIADIYADQLQDPRAAADALDQGLAIPGKSRAALDALRMAYEKLQRWDRVVSVLDEVANSIDEVKERSAVRFAAADVSLARVRDEVRGVRLLEQALEEDPANERGLHAITAVRTSRSEWAELERTYARLADVLATGDTERAWDLSRRLGVLRRDKLNDAAGAVEALTRAVKFKPEDVDARALLAEMHIAAGDEALAASEFERVAQIAPTRASTFARLFGLHRRAGRTDRAWLAGAALAELESADMDQQLFVDQYRQDGPIRPSRSLDDAAWDELLRAPGADDVVTEILRAIGATAAAARVEELRQGRLLVALDPARRQSATSTVSAVRSFYWAAQVLCVEPPDLYVMQNVPGGIAAVHAPAPTTALGPDVLRGLTTKDLAFVAGRHLTYYRPEHHALICYPTLNDLSALFIGAVKVVLPEVDASAPIREAAARHAMVLDKQASPDEKRRLAAAVDRLQSQGGRVDLAAWIRSVELSAQRAGLLLCGDLAVATARLQAEKETRAIAELTFDEKRGDLLAFCASDKLARARVLLGVDAHSSASTPPVAADVRA